jgi:hypothetical protein
VSEPRLQQHRRQVPLAFSQLAHWNLYQLSERPSSGMVSYASRLYGKLNLTALQESVRQIVYRHDALRTRIVVSDGVAMQEVADSGNCEIKIDDLSTLTNSLSDAEVVRLVEQYIFAPINVIVDPLFRVHLLRFGDKDHVLLVLMEHLISDGVSMGILLRDMLTAYAQAAKGRAISLPPVPLQFADYALWQRNRHESWLEKHGVYWDQHLKGCGRTRFPETKVNSSKLLSGLGNVPFRIGKILKDRLYEWCRQRKTTLVMLVFAAYAGFVLRLCDAQESVFPFENEGRVSHKTSETIGYFAFPLYLRIRLFDDDRLVDLLGRVTDEYCNAYEHADFSYMESQVPRPEFTKNGLFNWARPGDQADDSSWGDSGNAIEFSRVPVERRILTHLERDSEPFFYFGETNDEVVGCLQFSLGLSSFEAMEELAQSFIAFIEALLLQQETPIRKILIRK